MSDIAIRVENLGKRYRLGQMEPYRTLRDTLAGVGRKFMHRLTRPKVQQDDPADLWALKDVSFEIKQGEVVGIIGRNGAGKSTLLKILSRITEPTTGRAELFGRVGSLLEVGTGFHPELTGRENIYLNGAILGMTRGEIKGRFDEIVDFSEIEQFIDTPVKRYSSGMQMRLAFAVAAHLDPEIMIVDEVLAVGDANFQRKCLGQMQQVSRSGRTILFVSHNLAAVSALCTRGIMLQQGHQEYDGPTDDCLERYLALSTSETRSIHAPNKGFLLHQFTVTDQAGVPRAAIPFGEPFCVEVLLEMTSEAANVEPHVLVSLTSAATGARISSITTRETPCGPLSPGLTRLLLHIDEVRLLPGTYQWGISVKEAYFPDIHWEVVAETSIEERILSGASHPYTARHGVVCLCTRITKQTMASEPRPTSMQAS